MQPGIRSHSVTNNNHHNRHDHAHHNGHYIRPNPVPPDAQLGDSVDLEVSRATVCIYGDGYGTTTWLAGTDTSCEFVGAVHQKLVTGVNATTEDIRDFLPMDINVTSPVTGQEYQMSCTNESAKVSACRSNTNASVYFY